MNEIKQTSKWFILTSVLYVVTGLVMIVWPNLTMEMLGKALGIGMLVVGIGHIIIYFTKDHLESIMHMDLTVGVILAAFGAFMLFHEEFVSMALPFGVGILLLIGGIMKIQHSIDMKRLAFSKWFIMLAFAVVLIILGTILIYNPFKDAILIYYMAGSLILNGILSVVCVLMISHRMKRIARGKMPAGPAAPMQPAMPQMPAYQPAPPVYQPAVPVNTQGTDEAPGQIIDAQETDV